MTRLDIISDPVCPWCWIGLTELARALDSRPDHPFSIAYHPFRLNPQMPRGGMDRADFMRAKFGDRAEEMQRPVAERAAALGLALNPSPRQPDTTDAHRLMHWAGVEGAQSAVMSGILRAFWEEARDIGEPAVLAEIAGAAGMDAQVVARLLATDADRDTVAARESHARERGINSVPTFIVADRHAVSGAQPADLWRQVIDDLAGAGDQSPKST